MNPSMDRTTYYSVLPVQGVVRGIGFGRGRWSWLVVYTLTSVGSGRSGSTGSSVEFLDGQLSIEVFVITDTTIW